MHISPWYLRTQFVKLAWDLFTFSFLASFLLLLLEKRWCRKSNFRGLNPFNQISFPFKNPFKFYFNFNSSFREKESSCAWIDGTKWSSVKKIEHNFHFWNITICLFDFALWFERRTQPTIFFFNWNPIIEFHVLVSIESLLVFSLIFNLTKSITFRTRGAKCIGAEHGPKNCDDLILLPFQLFSLITQNLLHHFKMRNLSKKSQINLQSSATYA